MASKIKSVYVCSECGFESAKWNGRCPECGQWNTFVEEIKSNEKFNLDIKKVRYSSPVKVSEISIEDQQRYSTGVSELNRVLGGGIVKGSLILLGGDPGIGKSTMLLQICQYIGQTLRILYVSGEESARQIKLRAKRLNVDSDNLFIMAETNIEYIIETIKSEKPDLVVIDSIQTMSLDDLSSSPGSVSQVKECTNALLRIAKFLEIPIIIIGHVNKDGAIAGPKVLEHIVDCVLYFEGDRHLSYRILRAIKNRYGSTNEIGVFEMLDTGLKEVQNPSAMLLSGRPNNVPGSCVACVMEGSRPILAEVQGLVTSSGFGNPRRMSTGFDYNRMALILAVLEKRAGYFFSNMDCYINIVGGLKLDEPSADLAVALALVSGLKDIVINENMLAFGEIGLSGEIRSVSHVKERVIEAARLGFTKCIIPYHNAKVLDINNESIEIIAVKSIKQAIFNLQQN